MRVLLTLLVACSSTAGEQRPAPPTVESPNGDDRARYAEHIRELKQQLATANLADLAIRIERPFVVIGDGTDEQLARNASTVRWACDHLERGFFHSRPARIIDIYLFSSAEMYRAGVERLTGQTPDTPFGFYSPSRSAMFMNIATGGGTLVHEIVHPYVEADFPDAPPWLNEGLGSLFEQSASYGGDIIGLVNWRLAGLQRAIESKRLRSIRSLTALTSHAFYGDDTGNNYAHARYLLYYLQQRGKLQTFYRAFRANRITDPTGYNTLVATLGVRNMTAFQAEWRRFVMMLSDDE